MILITFLVMGGIILGIIRMTLIQDYIRLEREDMIKAADQIAYQMEDDLENLKSIVTDWAMWDDTYRFIQDLNQNYIDSNLTDETIGNLKLNFMVFLDLDKTIQDCRYLDPQAPDQKPECKETFLPFIIKNPALLRSEEKNDIMTGYTLQDDRIVLVASAPILTSQFKGPVMGTLVIGKYFDQKTGDILAKKFRIPIKLERYSGLTNGPEKHEQNNPLIDQTDPLIINARISFKSLSGQPLFVLNLEKKREIYLQGKRTLDYLLWTLAGVSLFFSAVMLIFLEKAVLHRLVRMGREVREITGKGYAGERILTQGKDEIASLSSDINQMLERISEDEKRYRILFESASDAILLLLEDRIVDCNLKALELFGYPREELLQLNPCDFSPDLQPDGQLSLEKYQNIMGFFSKKTSILFEWTHKRKDNTPFDAEVHLTAFDLPEGGRHVQAIIRDITERKKNQQVMAQAEKMLSLGGIAAGMAHEINNPLAGMIQNAQVLENRLFKNLPANAEAALEAGVSLDAIGIYMEKRNVRKLLHSISQAGAQAARIVGNMLQFAQKGYSEKKLEDITSLMENTISLAESDYSLTSKYDFKNIRVIKEYHQGPLLVPCHGSSLQQVFFNIIRNAAEAMASSGQKDIEPELIIRILKSDESVRIEIEDNGPGIDEGLQKKLFEPFFTTKGPGEGTGLGLSVSYFIITEDHKGKIEVQSETGKGTRFIIHLPL